MTGTLDALDRCIRRHSHLHALAGNRSLSTARKCFTAARTIASRRAPSPPLGLRRSGSSAGRRAQRPEADAGGRACQDPSRRRRQPTELDLGVRFNPSWAEPARMTVLAPRLCPGESDLSLHHPLVPAPPSRCLGTAVPPAASALLRSPTRHCARPPVRLAGAVHRLRVRCLSGAEPVEMDELRRESPFWGSASTSVAPNDPARSPTSPGMGADPARPGLEALPGLGRPQSDCARTRTSTPRSRRPRPARRQGKASGARRPSGPRAPRSRQGQHLVP